MPSGVVELDQGSSAGSSIILPSLSPTHNTTTITANPRVAATYAATPDPKRKSVNQQHDRNVPRRRATSSHDMRRQGPIGSGMCEPRLQESAHPLPIAAMVPSSALGGPNLSQAVSLLLSASRGVIGGTSTPVSKKGSAPGNKNTNGYVSTKKAAVTTPQHKKRLQQQRQDKALEECPSSVSLCTRPTNPSELLSLRVVLLTQAASLPGRHHATAQHATVGTPIPRAMKNIDLGWVQEDMVAFRVKEDRRLRRAMRHQGRVGESGNHHHHNTHYHNEDSELPGLFKLTVDNGPDGEATLLSEEYSIEVSTVDIDCGSKAVSSNNIQQQQQLPKSISPTDEEGEKDVRITSSGKATMNLLNFDELRLADDPVHHYDSAGNIIGGSIFDSLRRRKERYSGTIQTSSGGGGKPPSLQSTDEGDPQPSNQSIPITANQDQGEELRQSAKSKKLLTLINSPRSAVICLRNGIQPYQLLKRPPDYYARPGDGDSQAFAPSKSATILKGISPTSTGQLTVQQVRRWRYDQAEKQRVHLLSELRKQYASLCAASSLKEAVYSLCSGDVVGSSVEDRIGVTRQGLAERRAEELFQIEQRILWTSKIDEVQAQQRQDAINAEMELVARLQETQKQQGRQREVASLKRKEDAAAKERRRLICVEKGRCDREAQLADGQVKMASSEARLKKHIETQQYLSKRKSLLKAEKRARAELLGVELEEYGYILGDMSESKTNMTLRRYEQKQEEIVQMQRERNVAKGAHRERCNASALDTEAEHRDTILSALALASLRQQRLLEQRAEKQRVMQLIVASRNEHANRVKQEAHEAEIARRDRGEAAYGRVLVRQDQIAVAESTTIAWDSEKHQRDTTIKGLATNAVVEQNLFLALEESAKMQRKLDSISLNDAQQRLQIEHIQQVRAEARERQSALLAAKEDILRKVEEEHCNQRYLMDHPKFNRGHRKDTNKPITATPKNPARYSDEEFENTTDEEKDEDGDSSSAVSLVSDQ